MVKGQRMPPDLKERMRKTLIKIFSKKSKPFIQLTKKGDFVTTWNSLMELERIVGKRRQHVRDVCNGKRKTAYGYKWQYCGDLRRITPYSPPLSDGYPSFVPENKPEEWSGVGD